MAVRLLNRSEVDKRKAEEKRQAMEEGLKIAERVDTLRETLAAEEALFKKIHFDSLDAIQTEIAEKHKERESLDTQIREKKKEWKAQLEKMYGPLDTQWMTYVKEEKARIDSETARLAQIEANLQKEAARIAAHAQENAEKESTLDTERHEYQRLTADAKRQVAHAATTLASARNKAQELLSEAELKMANALKEEQRITGVAADLAIKEQELQKQHIELQEREYRVLAKELQYYSPVKRM